MEPKVGVSVFVRNNRGEFVLGKRRGSIGAGTWGLPGGHLEFGESFETCAAREVLEETGLIVHDLRFLAVVNSVMHAEGKHYAVVFVEGYVSEAAGGAAQPRMLEPESCTAWEWVSWGDLRSFDEDQKRSEGRRLFSPLSELFQ
ncbi:NUDIX hydrolase, partial [Penicillium canescens]